MFTLLLCWPAICTNWKLLTHQWTKTFPPPSTASFMYPKQSSSTSRRSASSVSMIATNFTILCSSKAGSGSIINVRICVIPLATICSGSKASLADPRYTFDRIEFIPLQLRDKPGKNLDACTAWRIRLGPRISSSSLDFYLSLVRHFLLVSHGLQSQSMQQVSWRGLSVRAVAACTGVTMVTLWWRLINRSIARADHGLARSRSRPGAVDHVDVCTAAQKKCKQHSNFESKT